MKFLSPSENLQLADAFGLLFSEPEAAIPAEAEPLALKAHFGPLLYWFAVQRNAGISPELERAFTSAAALQMVHEASWKKLRSRLEQAGIPFVPLKGLELAFHAYPAPALRVFNDWDVWFRRSDHRRLCALLKEDGWTCPLDCRCEHHWGDWIKGRFVLEPHFSLPNFSGVPIRELWHLTEPVSAQGVQRTIPGSLNLILMFQHNAIDHFRESRLLKLLIDTEFLLRSGSVDWMLVSALVRRWHLPHPGLLIAAFPEFFRNRWPLENRFPEDVVSSLRKLLLEQGSIGAEGVELRVAEARPADLSWIWDQLWHLRRDNLKWVYPQMGEGTLSYLHYLAVDLFRKVRLLIHPHLSPEAQTLLKQKQAIADSWKYGGNSEQQSR